MQNCLQRIKLGAAGIAMFVHRHARLRGIQREALLANDPGYRRIEAPHHCREIVRTPKRQVVRITRVVRTGGSGQTVQAQI